MFDYACIFTTGGVVLWCKAFCDTGFKLDFVNMLIKDVLLDDKTMQKNSYGCNDSVLRWKVDHSIKIVFAIVYKEILQLTLIDEFLEMLRFDFQKVLPKIVKQGGVIMTLPKHYDQRFSDILMYWEQQKKQGIESTTKSGVGSETKIHKMRTFDQSNKSKKSLKKEKKKMEREV